jgi:hypothetical protein
MKLTRFRAKDEADIKDLDEVGLIKPEIEANLSPILRERLARLAHANRTFRDPFGTDKLKSLWLSIRSYWISWFALFARPNLS